MAPKDTVLILGAGASVPYGFPTGAKLKEWICERLMNVKGRGSGPKDKAEFLNALIRSGYACDDLERFREEFEESPRESIDFFLMNKREFKELGRCILAAAICQHENADAMRPRSGHWYQWLYNYIGKGLNDFESNRLVILTLNYDRSCETYFSRAIEREYQLDKTRLRNVMVESFPVHHLHGSIGSLEQLVYATPIEKVDIKHLADNIRFIDEIRAEDDAIKQAQRYLWDAKKIYFFGCKFHNEYLQNIDISNEWPERSYGHRMNHPPPPAKTILGSCMDLFEADIGRVRSRFKANVAIDLHDKQLDVLGYLQKRGEL